MPALRSLWDVYRALQQWRGGSGMGAHHLTLHDLEAFERRYGVRLTAWESDLMKALDVTNLARRAT